MGVVVKRAVFAKGIFCISLFAVGLGIPNAWGQPDRQGQWTTLTYTMPVNPVHAALLNTGQVLVIAGSGNALSTNYQAAVWDPVGGTITTRSLTWDMFCNGMVVLHDGRPLIDGGTLQYNPFLGLSKAAVFDPVTSQFTDLPSMAHGRWYPTVTVLGDGTVMAFSGLEEATGTNYAVEIFNPSTGSWGPPHQAGWTPPLYPRLHLLPNGSVFYSGWSPQSRFYYPSTKSWSGVVATTNYANYRRYGSSVLLPLTPANNYKPEVLILGGNSPATATTELIDLSAMQPVWQWGPNMSAGRIQMNAVILPSGKVLALGGSVSDENKGTASLKADLYDPSTNTFSPAGANVYPRLYHSVALLLPDATVWVAGGNPQGNIYEPHMEIYQPAYLFNSDGSLAGRPTITGTPSTVGYGRTFAIQTPDAADISSVVLVKAGSVTHAFDMDQRLVGLSYTFDSGSLTVTGPPNSNIAPPGFYLVFILNSRGVPSVASFVQVVEGPNFSLTPAPPQQVIIPGQSTSFTVQSVPSGGFDGPINLNVSGVPYGATATFSTTSITGRGSSTLNVSTTGLQPASYPATYKLTLTGTSGTLTNTAPASLLVDSPGDFSLSAVPTALTATRGAPGVQDIVTVTPSAGFVGKVTFTIRGLPSNTTGKFSPTSVTSSGSTTLTLAAGSTAKAGSYALAIIGTSGALVHTTNMTLTVQ
jgi:hypothetical protein